MPVYLICDTSSSMNTFTDITPAQSDINEDNQPRQRRIDVLNDALCDLIVAVATAPRTIYRANLSVISFGSTARTNLPLSPVNSALTIKPLVAGGTTSYSAALSEFENRLNIDAQQRGSRRDFRPVAFFLTDGQPTEHTSRWSPICERLSRRSHPSLPPRILPCPIGEAKPGVLDRLTTSYSTDVKGFTGQILTDGHDVATAIHSIFGRIARTLNPAFDESDFPPTVKVSFEEQVAYMDTVVARAVASNESTTNFRDYLGGYR